MDRELLAKMPVGARGDIDGMTFMWLHRRDERGWPIEKPDGSHLVFCRLELRKTIHGKEYWAYMDLDRDHFGHFDAHHDPVTQARQYLEMVIEGKAEKTATTATCDEAIATNSAPPQKPA